MVSRREGIFGSLAMALTSSQSKVASSPGPSANRPDNYVVQTRTVLRTLDGRQLRAVHLVEPGVEGAFRWSEDDLSAQVSADPDRRLFLAPETDPTGASGAWIRECNGVINPKWFGATGDGKTDDSNAINNALSSGGDTVYFPAGTYHIENSIEIDGKVNVVAAKGAQIEVGVGLRKGVLVGKSTLHQGVIRGLRVVAEGRSSDHDSGVTDYGFEFLNCAQASYYDLEARWFRFPFHFNAQNGKRVSYVDFFNPQAIGGYRNITRQVAGTGFTNDINFFGGRCFPSASTETHAYIDGGNHIRFYGTRMEGSGAACKQAVYDNGHSNVYSDCRTEGTWSANDYVIGSDAIYTNIRAVNLYATVTDGGLNSFIQTGLEGSKHEIGIGDRQVLNLVRTGVNVTSNNPMLRLKDENSSSGQSYGCEVRLGRAYAGTGYTFRGVSDSDGAELFYSNQSGHTYTARCFEQGQSSWNVGSFKHGAYHEWYDGNGAKRVKSSAPSAETDGVPFAQKVGVPANGSAAGKPGDWAADSSYIYAYTGDGKKHSWVRAAAATW